MKLVAVSVVKNEADIIEAFVRHTNVWVDHHLVFDHDSTDGTREILGALAREGLPLSVFSDDALGNLQQARSNHLTRLAATEYDADWILLLDADEFLAGPGRVDLEQSLAAIAPATPASLLLLNYYPTADDDPAQPNPVLRLGHCERQQGGTRKLMVPEVLAVDQAVVAGKGSHVLYRGSESLPDQPLPGHFHLGHFPLRSPGQQAMRIGLAELQKLSRGRAHAGLDFHYRLSFQLLAENPELFFATSVHPVERLRPAPLAYRGGALRHTAEVHEWSRIIRAILPYLEKLATSHGELLDQVHPPARPHTAGSTMRRLSADELTASTFAGREDAYAGFTPGEGWEPEEGPIAETHLPHFHWGLAPATHLLVDSSVARSARLTIEGLTYSEGQNVTVELNGTMIHRHAFGRVNQRERIVCHLPLRTGENRLVLHYSAFLQTVRDPRKLAVIYLSLRITEE